MMKKRLFTAFLSLLLLLGLAGCGAAQLDQQMDRAEDAIENKLDQVEDAAETMLQAPVSTTAPGAAAGTAAPKLTSEEAEAIALEHAGFTADQVRYLHTEYEIDDGRPQYEVSFHQDRWEYDYEIDADTGAVISFEKDD